MQYGDLRGDLYKIISLLKSIERHTRCSSCGGDSLATTSGVNTDVPAGLRSVTIVKTSSNTDTVSVTLSDSTVYQLQQQNENFTQAASGDDLPAFTITGPGTWKWYGTK